MNQIFLGDSSNIEYFFDGNLVQNYIDMLSETQCLDTDIFLQYFMGTMHEITYQNDIKKQITAIKLANKLLLKSFALSFPKKREYVTFFLKSLFVTYSRLFNNDKHGILTNEFNSLLQKIISILYNNDNGSLIGMNYMFNAEISASYVGEDYFKSDITVIAAYAGLPVEGRVPIYEQQIRAITDFENVDKVKSAINFLSIFAPYFCKNFANRLYSLTKPLIVNQKYNELIPYLSELIILLPISDQEKLSSRIRLVTYIETRLNEKDQKLSSDLQKCVKNILIRNPDNNYLMKIKDLLNSICYAENKYEDILIMLIKYLISNKFFLEGELDKILMTHPEIIVQITNYVDSFSWEIIDLAIKNEVFNGDIAAVVIHMFANDMEGFSEQSNQSSILKAILDYSTMQSAMELTDFLEKSSQNIKNNFGQNINNILESSQFMEIQSIETIYNLFDKEIIKIDIDRLSEIAIDSIDSDSLLIFLETHPKIVICDYEYLIDIINPTVEFYQYLSKTKSKISEILAERYPEVKSDSIEKSIFTIPEGLSFTQQIEYTIDRLDLFKGLDHFEDTILSININSFQGSEIGKLLEIFTQIPFPYMTKRVINHIISPLAKTPELLLTDFPTNPSKPIEINIGSSHNGQKISKEAQKLLIGCILSQTLNSQTLQKVENWISEGEPFDNALLETENFSDIITQICDTSLIHFNTLQSTSNQTDQIEQMFISVSNAESVKMAINKYLLGRPSVDGNHIIRTMLLNTPKVLIINVIDGKEMIVDESLYIGNTFFHLSVALDEDGQPTKDKPSLVIYTQLPKYDFKSKLTKRSPNDVFAGILKSDLVDWSAFEFLPELALKLATDLNSFGIIESNPERCSELFDLDALKTLSLLKTNIDKRAMETMVNNYSDILLLILTCFEENDEEMVTKILRIAAKNSNINGDSMIEYASVFEGFEDARTEFILEAIKKGITSIENLMEVTDKWRHLLLVSEKVDYIDYINLEESDIEMLKKLSRPYVLELLKKSKNGSIIGELGQYMHGVPGFDELLKSCRFSASMIPTMFVDGKYEEVFQQITKEYGNELDEKAANEIFNAFKAEFSKPVQNKEALSYLHRIISKYYKSFEGRTEIGVFIVSIAVEDAKQDKNYLDDLEKGLFIGIETEFLFSIKDIARVYPGVAEIYLRSAIRIPDFAAETIDTNAIYPILRMNPVQRDRFLNDIYQMTFQPVGYSSYWTIRSFMMTAFKLVDVSRFNPEFLFCMGIFNDVLMNFLDIYGKSIYNKNTTLQMIPTNFEKITEMAKMLREMKGLEQSSKFFEPLEFHGRETNDLINMCSNMQDTPLLAFIKMLTAVVPYNAKLAECVSNHLIDGSLYRVCRNPQLSYEIAELISVIVRGAFADVGIISKSDHRASIFTRIPFTSLSIIAPHTWKAVEDIILPLCIGILKHDDLKEYCNSNLFDILKYIPKHINNTLPVCAYLDQVFRAFPEAWDSEAVKMFAMGFDDNDSIVSRIPVLKTLLVMGGMNRIEDLELAIENTLSLDDVPEIFEIVELLS